jgi:hypothetical protein
MRFRIASLEIEIDTNRPDVVRALAAAWVGFRSEGGAPDITLSYEAIDDHLVAQPPGRPYPGYATLAHSPREIVLQRSDGRLTVTLPADGPVTGHLHGLAAPWALETAMRALYSFTLPRRGGLLLHSAGLRIAEVAIVCCGPSGAGKSTLSTLLQARTGGTRLGDDMSVALPGGDGYLAHATPFAGELGPAPDGVAPLRRIYFLVKGARHHLTPLTRVESLGRLLRNTVTFLDDPVEADRILAAAAGLAGSVPTAILEFTRDPSIAEFLARDAGVDLD